LEDRGERQRTITRKRRDAKTVGTSYAAKDGRVGFAVAEVNRGTDVALILCFPRESKPKPNSVPKKLLRRRRFSRGIIAAGRRLIGERLSNVVCSGPVSLVAEILLPGRVRNLLVNCRLRPRS
jgi:hypothetical protein